MKDRDRYLGNEIRRRVVAKLIIGGMISVFLMIVIVSVISDRAGLVMAGAILVGTGAVGIWQAGRREGNR